MYIVLDHFSDLMVASRGEVRYICINIYIYMYIYIYIYIYVCIFMLAAVNTALALPTPDSKCIYLCMYM